MSKCFICGEGRNPKYVCKDCRENVRILAKEYHKGQDIVIKILHEYMRSKAAYEDVEAFFEHGCKIVKKVSLARIVKQLGIYKNRHEAQKRYPEMEEVLSAHNIKVYKRTMGQAVYRAISSDKEMEAVRILKQRLTGG